MTTTMEAPKEPERMPRAMVKKQTPMPKAPIMRQPRFPMRCMMNGGMIADAMYPVLSLSPSPG